MAHPLYQHIGTKEAKVIEECAALLQALMKVDRFGWDSTHPTTGAHNKQRVIEEMDDLVLAMDNLRTKLVGANT